jgi:hypothetical protein
VVLSSVEVTLDEWSGMTNSQDASGRKNRDKKKGRRRGSTHRTIVSDVIRGFGGPREREDEEAMS